MCYPRLPVHPGLLTRVGFASNRSSVLVWQVQSYSCECVSVTHNDLLECYTVSDVSLCWNTKKIRKKKVLSSVFSPALLQRKSWNQVGRLIINLLQRDQRPTSWRLYTMLSSLKFCVSLGFDDQEGKRGGGCINCSRIPPLSWILITTKNPCTPQSQPLENHRRLAIPQLSRSLSLSRLYFSLALPLYLAQSHSSLLPWFLEQYIQLIKKKTVKQAWSGDATRASLRAESPQQARPHAYFSAHSMLQC